MLAVVLAAALVAYPLSEPGPVRRALLLVGLVAVVTLGVAVLARWPRIVGWGLAALLLEYGFSLLGRDGLDVGAPLYAASLLVLGELAADLAGARQPRGPGRFVRQTAGVLAVAVGAATVASLVLAGAAILGERGPVVQVLGVAAAGAILVVLVLLANERGSAEDQVPPSS